MVDKNLIFVIEGIEQEVDLNTMLAYIKFTIGHPSEAWRWYRAVERACELGAQDKNAKYITFTLTEYDGTVRLVDYQGYTIDYWYYWIL